MSLFTPIATFTLSDQWQFTDVLVGSYFRVVHLTQPLNQDGQFQESSAAIAQADITGFIYTQDDFSHQTDPQSFVLEKPDILEVRKIGFRLLPNQTPWNIRIEALDATLLSSTPGTGVKGDKGDKGDKGVPGSPDLTLFYTKSEIDTLLLLKQNALPPSPPPLSTRKSDKNPLVYTPTQRESYSLLTGTVNLINDNNLTAGIYRYSGGTSGRYGILISFDAPVFLNEIKIYPGQFNGPFNMPTAYSIKHPTNGTTLASGSIDSVPYGTPFTVDLLPIALFDTPLSSYEINFYLGSENEISVNELDVFGAVA